MLPPIMNTEAVFLKPRTPFKLASFNVRTLMHIRQQIGLAMSLEGLNVDVCCLSETRIQDSSEVLQIRSPSVASKSLFHVRLSGDPVASSSGLAGVGVALSARAEAALIDWIPINSRLCAVRLESSIKVRRNRREKRCLFVISAYAPTDCSPDAIKDEFYHQLTVLLQKARSTDIVVLAGDLNAQVGRLGTEESRLGGRWGLVGRRTDNGDRLLQLCTDHNLFLASTNFRHSHRRCATWRPPSASQAWTQIDHIAISYRWRGCVQDCRSFWSTYLESDHALVCANLTLLFSGRRIDHHQRIDVSKLVATSVASKYRAELASRLATIPPKSIDEHWLHLHDAMKMASKAACGFAKRPAYKHWVSSGSLQLMEARRSTPGDREFDHKRRLLRNEIGQSLRKDREAWWSERANEMEAAAASGNCRKLFQLIRATGSKKSGVSETIYEDDGMPITNISRRLGRWAEFFEGQFNWPAAPATSTSLSCPPWPVTTDPPNEAEVLKELQLLKRYKSPGPDDLPPALFKDGGDFLTKELTVLFGKVWEQESVPTSWNESIVVPIFKKGSRCSCNNYRGISLLPIASKLLASVILRRLFKTRERLTREEQAGFRSGRGCIDHIFTLRQMLEHRHTYRRPTIVVFLDIRAAFDSLDRTVLWDCLLKKGVPEKFINILKALYTNTSGRVRAYNHLSPLFHSSSGVRQGCPISPFLFNFAIDDILETALMDVSNGGVDLLPGERLLDLEYADDIVLLCDNAQGMQSALNQLAISVRRYGMCFAPSKCKVLLQDWQDSNPVLTLDGEQIEVVEKFVYLGSYISAGGGVSDEIDARIMKARAAYANLGHLWRLRDVSLAVKGRIYNASVRAVLLYACETWPLRVEDVRRLSVFDHRCLRRIADIQWQHHVSNAEVRHRVFGRRDDNSIGVTILKHRLRWLGHVLRMSSQRLPRRALFADSGTGWKKRRGGQCMTWCRGMKESCKGLASVGPSRLPGWGPRDGATQWLETLSDMAQNRSQWRSCCNLLLLST